MAKASKRGGVAKSTLAALGRRQGSPDAEREHRDSVNKCGVDRANAATLLMDDVGRGVSGLSRVLRVAFLGRSEMRGSGPDRPPHEPSIERFLRRSTS